MNNVILLTLLPLTLLPLTLLPLCATVVWLIVWGTRELVAAVKKARLREQEEDRARSEADEAWWRGIRRAAQAAREARGNGDACPRCGTPLRVVAR